MTSYDIHHHAYQGNGELMLDDDGVLATLPNAWQQTLEDWVALGANG